MAKNLERIGDHTTNIAETLYFLVHGKPLAQIRPKRDRTVEPSVLDDDDHREGAA
jgi:phosphate transport system protein